MLAALGKQVGGSHYLFENGIQPVQFIAANNWDFFAGNVLKYLVRWRSKGGLQDLKKCRHYAELRFELAMERHYPHADKRPAIWMNDFIRANRIEPALDPVLLALELWVIGGTVSSRVAFLDLLDGYTRDVEAEFSTESL